MVIESSAARERARLLAALEGPDEVAREAAIARLTILGPRVVDALLARLGEAPPPATAVAVLRALEGIGDPRALPLVGRLLDERDTPRPVALAAVAVLRRLLAASRAADADAALDRLAALALDPARDEAVRLAALDALDDLPPSTRATLDPALARDPNPRIRARAGGRRGAPAPDPSATIELAAAGRLPEHPDRVAATLREAAARVPIATLHQLLVAVRAREAAVGPAERHAWVALRGLVHQVLAARGSTIARYDLRETLAAAREPLPIGFLAALAQIGDATCLEPLAAAYAQATGPARDWWRTHLASAFRDILRRKRLTRRHAAVQRVIQRWPQHADELLPGSAAPRRRGRSAPPST
jgi:hypothetical protein